MPHALRFCAVLIEKAQPLERSAGSRIQQRKDVPDILKHAPGGALQIDDTFDVRFVVRRKLAAASSQRWKNENVAILL